MTNPPLLLVPGVSLDATLWDHQARHLAEVADVRVMASSGHDSVEALAGALLDSAPERFLLAGLSLGGYVAMEIMRRAPARVIKLALLDTNARPDTTEATETRRQAIALVKAGRFPSVVAASLPRLIHPARLDDRELTLAIRQQGERVGAEAYIRQQTAIIARPDSRPGLPAVACPTLVLCGRQDVLSPLEMHIEMAGLIPGARLAVIEDCGHLPPMERPQAATALLRDWILYA